MAADLQSQQRFRAQVHIGCIHPPTFGVGSNDELPYALTQLAVDLRNQFGDRRIAARFRVHLHHQIRIDTWLEAGVPTIAMMVTFPFMVRHLDVRIAVGFGFLLYAISCFLNSTLTPFSAGGNFVTAQVLRGFAMFFTMIFLNQAATSAVSREYADDASGLFNAARNLGGSIELAVIATLQDRRESLHFARIAESMSANSQIVQDAVQSQGLASITDTLTLQANVITFSDLYWLFGVALLVVIPLVFVMKPLNQAQA